MNFLYQYYYSIRNFVETYKILEFNFNPYEPCFTNKIKVGKQHTLRFHADNIISSHVNPKVNDNFKEWMNQNHGKNDEVKTNIGKVHEYLGINFDFTSNAKVKINMDDYVESMINEYLIKISRSNREITPAMNNICEKGNKKSPGKNKLKSSIIH